MRALIGVLVGGLMVAVSACATTPPPLPPSVDVSGTWVGYWSAFEGAGGRGDLKGIFRQDGSTLYGNFEVSNPTVNRTYVSGMVTGNEVRLFAPSQGTLVVIGDEMTGTLQGLVSAQVKLRKQP
jgi:hypothetical protein